MKLEDFIDENKYRKFLSDILIDPNNLLYICGEYNDLYFSITANKKVKGVIYYNYALSYNSATNIVVVVVEDSSDVTLSYVVLNNVFDKMLKDLVSGMEELIITLPKELKKFNI